MLCIYVFTYVTQCEGIYLLVVVSIHMGVCVYIRIHTYPCGMVSMYRMYNCRTCILYCTALYVVMKYWLQTSISSLLSPWTTISQDTALVSIAATSSSRNNELFRVESLKLRALVNLPEVCTYEATHDELKAESLQKHTIACMNVCIYKVYVRMYVCMYVNDWVMEWMTSSSLLESLQSTNHDLNKNKNEVLPSRSPTWEFGRLKCHSPRYVQQVLRALAESICSTWK